MTVKLLSIYFILSMALVSCGDLFTTDKKEATLGNILGATCELNTENFSDILRANIRGDILCLENKISLFMSLVKTDKPGFVSKVTLKEFLKTGPVDVGDDDISPIIDSVFDLSYLIFGGTTEHIAEANIKKLIDILIYFNQHIWKVYLEFSRDVDVNYQAHMDSRDIILSEMTLLSNKLRDLLKINRGGKIDRINSELFITNFFDADPQGLADIKSLMFLKTVFLGGERMDLTHIELEEAFFKLPELSLIAFDVARAKRFVFADDLRAMFKVYNKDLKIFRDNLYYGNDSEKSLFTTYDVFTALENLVPDLTIGEGEFPLRKYPREFIVLKEILMDKGQGGANGFGKHFHSVELVNLFEHAEFLFDQSEFFFRMYTEYSDELDSRRPVSVDFSGFPATTQREEEFKANFTRIAYDYRYMKGNFDAPYFSFNIYRNPAAMVEIASIEYGVTLVMKKYGQKFTDEEGKEQYHMAYSKEGDDVMPLVEKIKRPLKDLGLTTIGRVGGGEATAIADNLVLMSTLFQNQSNGCDKTAACMEVPELTEFLVGLVTALSIKDFFVDQMEKLCGNEVDSYGRIYVKCFRENFLEVIKTPMPGSGNSLSKYFPMLFSYIEEMTKDLPAGANPTDSADYMKFLTETESFTRTCTHFDEENPSDDTLLPMKGTDTFGVFAGLLNVESTVLRFDADENNKMNGGEVEAAYHEVYNGAIKGLVTNMVPLSGGLLSFASRQIYYYLIKYGEAPEFTNGSSIWRFLLHIVRLNKKKKAVATRTTIASVLKALGNTSENAKTHPFKCAECLSDPTTECAPDGDDADTWDYEWEVEEYKN
jgi:hypothetical protein